jgi:hypothetical protein
MLHHISEASNCSWQVRIPTEKRFSLNFKIIATRREHRNLKTRSPKVKQMVKNAQGMGAPLHIKNFIFQTKFTMAEYSIHGLFSGPRTLRTPSILYFPWST